MIRFKNSLKKNAPEIGAWVTGRMPGFVLQRGELPPLSEIPVFVFHSTEPERLEAQLLHLQSNGYRTLDADELASMVLGVAGSGREVVLTFDDGTWTFWAYVFPLLQRYKMKVILFAIPGLIPEDSTRYPNLADVWGGTNSLTEVKQRGVTQPLCTWREFGIMHESGLVDIQSHSLTHSRVAVSSRLVDFLHPGFDTDLFGNVAVPVSSLDDLACPERKLRLGAPVFKSAPRLAGRLRWKEPLELVRAMADYVEKHGGKAFFACPHWRRELIAVFRQRLTHEVGTFETPEEMESAIWRELERSKLILQDRLVNKTVKHFCYPWFAGSDISDRLAVDAGYRTVHYGLQMNKGGTQATEQPLRIRRISEEYLFRLPGEGRHSLQSVWAKRFNSFCGEVVARS